MGVHANRLMSSNCVRSGARRRWRRLIGVPRLCNLDAVLPRTRAPRGDSPHTPYSCNCVPVYLSAVRRASHRRCTSVTSLGSGGGGAALSVTTMFKWPTIPARSRDVVSGIQRENWAKSILEPRYAYRTPPFVCGSTHPSQDLEIRGELNHLN